jgi:TetR/AcrR family transcriptional regulator, regulator of mycofactocin system
MRTRMSLIAAMPTLSFSAAEHHESWEQAIREFAGQRLDRPAESLARYGGRSVLAVYRAAYDRWSARGAPT